MRADRRNGDRLRAGPADREHRHAQRGPVAGTPITTGPRPKRRRSQLRRRLNADHGRGPRDIDRPATPPATTTTPAGTGATAGAASASAQPEGGPRREFSRLPDRGPPANRLEAPARSFLSPARDAHLSLVALHRQRCILDDDPARKPAVLRPRPSDLRTELRGPLRPAFFESRGIDHRDVAPSNRPAVMPPHRPARRGTR